jgi:hypothetical protein
MKIYDYDNYDEYIEAQIRGSKRTSHWVWIKEPEIETAARILREKKKSIEFGICHGVRTGSEQKWFKQYLGDVEVIGTDIAAADTPGTLEWDFHDIKPEWEGNVDFIYSNSFDHTCDPQWCLKQWMRCLKPGGYCILHWSKGQQTSNKRDPFGATLEEYKEFISNEGYVLEDVSGPENKRFLLWIQKEPHA